MQNLRRGMLVTGHKLRLWQQQCSGSLRQRVRGHRVRRRGRAAGGRLHHRPHLRRHQRPGVRLHLVRGRSVSPPPPTTHNVLSDKVSIQLEKSLINTSSLYRYCSYQHSNEIKEKVHVRIKTTQRPPPSGNVGSISQKRLLIFSLVLNIKLQS